MLLHRLCEHAAQLDLPPPMYLRTPIRWLIDLDGQGRFLGFVITEGSGSKNDRGKQYFAPHRERTVAVAAKLLADNAEYVLGIARDPDKQARVDGCHKAFVDEVRRCAEHTHHPGVEAVLRFLRAFRRSNLTLPEGFKADHTLTFRVDGLLPIESEEVRSYWANTAGVTSGGTGGQDVQSACLVCGRAGQPLKNVPFKIKHIPGGQTSGMALLSTNAPAFESYRLGGVSCAPICPACGEQFSKAVNSLIEGRGTHLDVGPLVYLFWARDGSWSPLSVLGNPEPEEVRALLLAVFGGDRNALHTDPTPFYATALSANGARVVVRDWLETTVPKAKANLARYFALQNLVGEGGEEAGGPEAPFLPLHGYLTDEFRPRWRDGLAESVAPVRQGRRDVRGLPATVPQTLLRVALGGGSLSLSLLQQVIQRTRAEQAVSRPRAALVKMVLLSRSPDKENTMVQLEPGNRDPAYLCGRLLAVLETLQRAAIPGTKATITDRYFGTASSAPASVFGRLLRGAQPHLGKLRKETPGTYDALQQQLEEIQAGLLSFPRLLNLQEQGAFALGYYHQRAADRAARAARLASRSQ